MKLMSMRTEDHKLWVHSDQHARPTRARSGSGTKLRYTLLG